MISIDYHWFNCGVNKMVELFDHLYKTHYFQFSWLIVTLCSEEQLTEEHYGLHI